MKKVLFLLLFASYFSHAQNKSIDFAFGEKYNYRLLIATKKSTSGSEIVKKVRDGIEKPSFSQSYGIFLNKKIAEKQWLRFGLRYNPVTYIDKETDNVMWGSEHDGMGGWKPDPSLPHTLKLTRTYQYLDFTFAYRKMLSEKKWRSFFEIGIAPTVYLGTTLNILLGTDASKIKRKEPDVNSFSMNIQYSYGVERDFGKNFSFVLQPTFYNYILPTSLKSSVKEFLVSGSLEVAVRYKL